MKFFSLFVLAFVGVVSAVHAASIAHDKVQPLAQPEPVTVSEKAGVMFKPQIEYKLGCTSFPAVNAAGETSTGLPADGLELCDKAPLGSQVYGRATWFNDVWAIMYAWYYPKSIISSVGVETHDWQNAVVWISNPAVASPKVMGLSTSKRSETDYMKPVTMETFKSEESYDKITTGLEKFLNGTSPKLTSTRILGPVFLRPATDPGVFQDLVMWDQLPAPARTALNGPDIGRVPFNDDRFQKKLKEAWPF